jgi:hypothetical protein
MYKTYLAGRLQAGKTRAPSLQRPEIKARRRGAARISFFNIFPCVSRVLRMLGVTLQKKIEKERDKKRLNEAGEGGGDIFLLLLLICSREQHVVGFSFGFLDGDEKWALSRLCACFTLSFSLSRCLILFYECVFVKKIFYYHWANIFLTMTSLNL